MAGAAKYTGSASGLQEMRVVLLGKTGAGKSSLGNTLLGEDRDVFRVARGMCSGTGQCQWAEVEKGSVLLQVTDTPGPCDTHRDEELVLREVGKSMAVSAPGPHVILMVLRCDRRFTEEEHQAYITLKTLFGEGICQHMIVVFAGVDTFGDTPEEQEEGLRQDTAGCSPPLRQVLRDAGHRIFPVNNRAPRLERDRQAASLLRAMQALVQQNNGRHFTSDLIDQVGELKEQLIQRRMKGNVSRRDATRSANRDIADGNVDTDFLDTILHILKTTVVPILIQVVKSKAFQDAMKAVAQRCSLM